MLRSFLPGLGLSTAVVIAAVALYVLIEWNLADSGPSSVDRGPIEVRLPPTPSPASAGDEGEAAGGDDQPVEPASELAASTGPVSGGGAGGSGGAPGRSRRGGGDGGSEGLGRSDRPTLTPTPPPAAAATPVVSAPPAPEPVADDGSSRVDLPQRSGVRRGGWDDELSAGRAALDEDDAEDLEAEVADDDGEPQEGDEVEQEERGIDDVVDDVVEELETEDDEEPDAHPDVAEPAVDGP